MSITYKKELILVSMIIVIGIGSLLLQNSFAQGSLKSDAEISPCGFVQFCSNPTVVERIPSNSGIISPMSTSDSNTQSSTTNSTEKLRDYTSSISLIMTPDLPNKLAEKDLNPSNQTKNQLGGNTTLGEFSIRNFNTDLVNQSILRNLDEITYNLAKPVNETINIVPTNLTLSPLNQTSTKSNSTIYENNDSNLVPNPSFNKPKTSWKNFTSTNGFSLSYPPEWILQPYENEVIIGSNQYDSDYYPKLIISIRDLDPALINNSLLVADILPVDNIPSETANLILHNPKTLSNIGLKYYIDLGYDVIESTQEGKYVIDGKHASAFTVYKSDEKYDESEHITVNNDGKIYSIEIDSHYFPSYKKEANQLNQIKENILESIKWMNKTKPTIPEFNTTKAYQNKSSIENASKGISISSSDKIDEDEIKKTISSSDSSLNITSSTDFFDDENFKIVGEVLNKGPNIRQLVEVIITLYDSNNNMMGTELTYTNPTDLNPQQSAPFEIMINPDDVRNVSEIKSYKLYLTASKDQIQSSSISERTSMLNQSIPSTENKVYVVPINENQILKYKEFAMDATLSENKGFGNFSTTYPVESFEFTVGPNNTICPENNCEFEIEDGSLWSFKAGEYTFGGVMKISAQEEDGKRSKFMDIDATLNVGEILEKNGVKIEKLGGYFDLGTSISYRLTNSSLITNEDEMTLSLKGSEIK